MYAVVRTGGKQYRVAAGDTLEVEKLEGDIGDMISIDDVLLVSNGDRVISGQPVVANAAVQAVISGQYRGPKILSFRYRAKKRIRVRKGHRQYLTRLEIASVNLDGESFTTAVQSAPAKAAAVVEDVVTPIIAAPVIEEPILEEAVVEEVATSLEEAATDVADDVVDETVDSTTDTGDNATVTG